MKYAILGAGLTGLTIARLLSDAGHSVTIYEKNEREIGGMCYEETEYGVTYSKYGPHIFHTNDEEVWRFVKERCEMIPYNHKVKAMTKKGVYNWPINYTVLKDIFGGSNKNETFEKWVNQRNEDAEEIGEEDNFENKAIKFLGNKMYDLFIKTYTTTQWRTDPKKLPSELFGRIRVEETENRNFFSDKYVALAKYGFNNLCDNLSYKIDVIYKEITHKDLDELKAKYDTIISTIPPWILLNEEPLDMIKIRFCDLYDAPFGKVKDIYDTMVSHNPSVLNLCNNTEFTRLTNYGNLYNHLNIRDKYILEKPDEFGIPLYPIRLKENVEKADNMVLRLEALHGIISVGRLGKYKYINMDEAIRQGIDLYNMLEGEF